jgi:hypothetical protein
MVTPYNQSLLLSLSLPSSNLVSFGNFIGASAP